MYPLGISNSCGCLQDEEQVPRCAEGGKALHSRFAGHRGAWKPCSGLRVQLHFAEHSEIWTASPVFPGCVYAEPCWGCVPVIQKFRNSPAWHRRSAQELTVWVYVFHSCPSPESRCICRATVKVCRAQTGFLSYLSCPDVEMYLLYFRVPGKPCTP